jgi:hypothetical protein
VDGGPWWWVVVMRRGVRVACVCVGVGRRRLGRGLVWMKTSVGYKGARREEAKPGEHDSGTVKGNWHWQQWETDLWEARGPGAVPDPRSFVHHSLSSL